MRTFAVNRRSAFVVWPSGPILTPVKRPDEASCTKKRSGIRAFLSLRTAVAMRARTQAGPCASSGDRQDSEARLKQRKSAARQRPCLIVWPTNAKQRRQTCPARTVRTVGEIMKSRRLTTGGAAVIAATFLPHADLALAWHCGHRSLSTGAVRRDGLSSGISSAKIAKDVRRVPAREGRGQASPEPNHGVGRDE